MDGQKEHYFHHLKSVEKRRDRSRPYFLWTGVSEEIGGEDYLLLWRIQTIMSGVKISSECQRVKIEHYNSRSAYQNGEIVPMPIEIYANFLLPFFHKNRTKIMFFQSSHNGSFSCDLRDYHVHKPYHLKLNEELDWKDGT